MVLFDSGNWIQRFLKDLSHLSSCLICYICQTVRHVRPNWSETFLWIWSVNKTFAASVITEQTMDLVRSEICLLLQFAYWM